MDEPPPRPREDDFRSFLRQPLTIGGRTVANRLFLAPMAGLGHVAFRELVAGYGGCGLMFTGMLSARALPHENPAVSQVFRWRPEELGALVGQIFGPDPGSMARAAERLAKEGFFGVDLNFGCSVAAICKKGCGAALLKNPGLASEIVAGVRRAVDLPLFVQVRTGWEDDPDLACDLAKRFEDAGADALVFHPRVAPDRRSRPPRWPYIARVRRAVAIPVFGNGNLFQASDGETMVRITGCHGLSIGRMAVAAPWIFAEWLGDFVPGPDVYRRPALDLARLLPPVRGHAVQEIRPLLLGQLPIRPRHPQGPAQTRNHGGRDRNRGNPVCKASGNPGQTQPQPFFLKRPVPGLRNRMPRGRDPMTVGPDCSTRTFIPGVRQRMGRYRQGFRSRFRPGTIGEPLHFSPAPGPAPPQSNRTP